MRARDFDCCRGSSAVVGVPVYEAYALDFTGVRAAVDDGAALSVMAYRNRALAYKKMGEAAKSAADQQQIERLSGQ